MTTMVHITPPPLSSQSMADLLSTIVLLCRGKDQYKRNFWAYMCIKPSMAESFKAARDSGSLCLGEYGTIIEAGEGDDAPQDIQERMQRDYAVRADYEELLLKTIEEIRRRKNA